jgi:hypothetical protein
MAAVQAWRPELVFMPEAAIAVETAQRKVG